MSGTIAELAPTLVGKDPRAWEAHVALMYALRRQASGGVIQQAIGAIENALLDVKARALGIPVYELLAGPVRERIRLYWSHCATYRTTRWKEMQVPPVRTLDHIVALGKEVVAKGYTALKTNVLLLGENPRGHTPGFARGEGGVAESLKIAAMADAYETNVAPHNFYGHLATMMNAHFSALVPNLRIMEIDPDMVPWQGDLVTVRPDIKDGYLTLPSGPGWGTEVNEAAVQAHPPKGR